ncbi:MAG: ribosomal RNA small subunit methyltransferase A, partial [Clostridiales bacterium]|nr:ribosomal RNA small subunit methyltransferase A [Clostridiales bacterium]
MKANANGNRKKISGHGQNQEFHHKKSLGQNFLADASLLDRLVDLAGVTEDDEVLEIGTGLGSLTERLALRCRHVTTVEIDDTLIPILNVTLVKYSNVTLVHANALKLDLRQLTAGMGSFRIVANIPYYLTTELLTKLLKADLDLLSVSVMVQKEAADRITAVPGDEAYGILSVRTAWKGIAEQMLDVPADLFDPPPKVDSSFVNIVMRQQQPVPEANGKLVMRVAEAAFL